MMSENIDEILAKFSIDQRAVVLALMLIAFVDVLGYTLILPIIPTIMNDFNSSFLFMGLLIASNAFAAFLFSPIWGRLSDRFGRKPMLLTSQAGTLVAFLILFISPSIEVILFSRILDGIFGGQIPVIRAFISDVTDRSNRGTILAKFMNAFIFGMILGPAAGGILGGIDWRLVPIFGATLCAISIGLTLRILVETMPKERVQQIKEEKIILSKAESSLGVKTNALLTSAFVILLLSFMFVDFGHNSFSNSVLFILDELGAIVTFTGFLLMIAGVMFFVVSQFLYQPLMDKLGETRLTTLGFIITILAFLVYPFLTELWMFFVFVIPFDFGMAILMPTLQMKITFAAPESRQGEASGWISNVQSVNGIFAPLLVTAFLTMSSNRYLLIGVTSAIVISFAFLVISLARWRSTGEIDPMEAMMRIGEGLKKKGFSDDEMMALMGSMGGISMEDVLVSLGDIETKSKEEITSILENLGATSAKTQSEQIQILATSSSTQTEQVQTKNEGRLNMTNKETEDPMALMLKVGDERRAKGITNDEMSKMDYDTVDQKEQGVVKKDELC